MSFENRVYQIKSGSANYSPASRKVQIRQYLDGKLHIFYRDGEVEFEEINPGKEKRKKFIKGRKASALAANKPSSPAADHPWRQQFHRTALNHGIHKVSTGRAVAPLPVETAERGHF